MSRFALKDLTGKVSGLYSNEQKQFRVAVRLEVDLAQDDRPA